MSLSKPAFDFSKRPAIAKRGTIPKAVGGFSNAQINAWFTDCCVDVNGAVVHSGRGIIHIKYSGGHAPAPGFTQLRQDLEKGKASFTAVSEFLLTHPVLSFGVRDVTHSRLRHTEVLPAEEESESMTTGVHVHTHTHL